MSTQDDQTVDGLVELALDAPEDSDERWDAIRTLHERNDQETFDTATQLCASDDPLRRTLGVDVLAQLGATRDHDERPYRVPAVDLLLELLPRETDLDTLASIAYAFGHLDDARAIGPLAALRDHPCEDVRYAAVFGLLGHDDDLAVDTLVALSRDSDSDVRDWATFGLGSQIERDTPQVREALVARLRDEDHDTREEAISGLGARGDARAVGPLVELLDEGWGGMLVEALINLSSRVDDPRLAPHITALLDAAEQR